MNRSHGLHFVDLFAGCGGLSLGLEIAGFHPVFVNELNRDALDTYLTNRSLSAPKLALPEFHCHDVKMLVQNRKAIPRLSKHVAAAYGCDPREGALDLVVGGPPCQGFSGIGHRRSYSVTKEQLPSNHLYEDMLYVVNKLRPKLFLFENVKGLLSARWTPSGEKGEIWHDILSTYVDQLDEYVIESSLVHAKDYGVPQNRPRVLMVGIRRDIARTVELDRFGPAKGLLPRPGREPPDLHEVLGDLLDPTYKPGMEATRHYPSTATKGTVQEYFRADPLTHAVRKKGAPVTEHEYSNHAPRIVEKFQYMIDNGGEIAKRFRTKKFAQRVLPRHWGRSGPTITATSLPDDYVHYRQPRSLTVREWARLQTFPDWYQFRGKRTTGGLRRAGNPREGLFDRELPKYTQIGNAVPVQLAEAIGKHFATLLGRSRKAHGS